MGAGDDERFGSEEPTKPSRPPSIESAIRNFALSLGELLTDCRATANSVKILEGDERRRQLLGLAEKMEECSAIVGEASRVVRALSDLANPP
jgi:hypothetical protein